MKRITNAYLGGCFTTGLYIIGTILFVSGTTFIVIDPDAERIGALASYLLGLWAPVFIIHKLFFLVNLIRGK